MLNKQNYTLTKVKKVKT